MPKYGMPGVTVDRTRSRVIGVLVLALAVVVAGTCLVVSKFRDDDRLRVVLQTEQIGDGIVAGTEVRLNGVTVGTVEHVEPGEAGQQLITLQLNDSRLFGITDSLGIDYAPANLFGISEVELVRGTGGDALREGETIDLAGDNADKVEDATMGALIRSLTQTTTKVLTPQLTEMLRTFAYDLEAFTPLLESIIAIGRLVTETQRFAPSFLIGEFGSALTGAAPLVGGTIELLDRINQTEVLRNQQPLFDSGIRMIVDDMFPAVSTAGITAQRYFTGYADMLGPLVSIAAQMVPNAQLSSAQLQQFISRLDAAFADSPEGPALSLALTLRGVPALSVPLLGPNPVGAP
jgi:hypothetical protein